MPVYDYVCMACGTRIEVMHRVDESGPAICTSCGGQLRKALSAPAIVFRGSGWAKKDARKDARATGDGDAGKGEKGAATSEPATPKPADSTTGVGDKPAG